MEIVLWENAHKRIAPAVLDRVWGIKQPLFQQLQIGYDLQLAQFLETE
jgi:hypothetical protein